jgi:hypothetical protein
MDGRSTYPFGVRIFNIKREVFDGKKIPVARHEIVGPSGETALSTMPSSGSRHSLILFFG